jgi:hypothetical protein
LILDLFIYKTLYFYLVTDPIFLKGRGHMRKSFWTPIFEILKKKNTKNEPLLSTSSRLFWPINSCFGIHRHLTFMIAIWQMKAGLITCTDDSRKGLDDFIRLVYHPIITILHMFVFCCNYMLMFHVLQSFFKKSATCSKHFLTNIHTYIFNYFIDDQLFFRLIKSKIPILKWPSALYWTHLYYDLYGDSPFFKILDPPLQEILRAYRHNCNYWYWW